MKDDGSLNTLVGKDSMIEGNMRIKGSLRIDGYIKGEVKCSELLTIGLNGTVEGSVKARHLVLGGKVLGDVFAEERIELQNKSLVEGDITTKSLVVEAGAVFHGKSNMKQNPTNQIKEAAKNKITDKSDAKGNK